jgi:hypothetical protein
MTKLICLIRRCGRNPANFRSRPAPEGAASSGSIALLLLESFASLSVWLPALLTFYALARWLDMPLAAHLIVGSAILFAVWGRRAALTSFDSTFGTDFEFIDLALLLSLIALLLLPVVASTIYAFADTPRFHYPDDAALLSIAQGQRLAFPPPDLRWAGETNHYHQGEALLVEGLARLTGAPLSVTLYGIAPALIRIAFLGACWRFLSTLFPTWSLRQRVAAIAVACGAFFVDPFAIVWNLHNLVVTRALNLPTVFFGVPIAGVIPVSVPNGLFYSDSSIPADIFLFGAISNIGRSGPIPVGAALAASYLAKSQVGLPALCGLLFAAGLLCLVMKRWQLSIILPIVVALTLLAFFRLLGPGIQDLVVGIGLGHNLKDALAAGYPFAKALGLISDQAAIVFGLFLYTSKWSVPLVLAAVGLYFARVNLDHRGVTLVVAMASAAAATVAFATIVVIHPGAELSQKFVETHSDVAHLLFVPFSGYLDYLFTYVSTGAANSFVTLPLALLAGAALIEMEVRASSRFWKSLTRIGICAAWLVFIISMVLRADPNYAQFTARSKVVDAAAVEALLHIPVHNTITMTNELAYDREKAPYLPYMNAWAPALHGHQFWVADFMFDLHYPDIVRRFRAWKRFWNATASPWHEQLLEREGIGWILEKKNESLLDPGTIRGVELVFENEKYRVFRFTRH